MVFENYLMPFMPNHTKSILDYDVKIENLRPEATFFVPAETGMKYTFYDLINDMCHVQRSFTHKNINQVSY